MSSKSTIYVKDLEKTFQIPIKKPGLTGAFQFLYKKETKIVQAVDKISFEVNEGELVGFLGPNGAGKTTTLKMLSGLLYPTSGEVEIMGFVPYQRHKEFQMNFSMVMGQRTQLWWDLPARETFELNQRIFEIPDKEFHKRLDEIIELLDIGRLIDVPVKKLSLGERMKAELTCAILHHPKILLLDEPTLGLDLVMQKRLRDFVRDYNRDTSSTILLTSHNMADVEELCKRVIIIDGGRILYDGDLSKIVERFAPNKLITLSSSKVLDPQDLKSYGQLISHTETSAKIEIPRKEVSQVMGKLLAELPVVDLAIEELPIEEIIRRVFLKNG